MQIKLTLNDRKDWSLYVLESDSDGYVLIGSCESKISSSCKGGIYVWNVVIPKHE